MIKTVFITRPVPQKGLDLILSAPNVKADIWEDDLPPPRDILLEKVRGIDGLYCLITENIDEELLDAAGPHLKVVSQMAVGYDNIDVAACTQYGIPVGNTPGVLTEATADLTMALLLGTARQPGSRWGIPVLMSTAAPSASLAWDGLGWPWPGV
jgi:lactate dehydrogenase-like 2-hydroxyacid dehydrogenase